MKKKIKAKSKAKPMQVVPLRSVLRLMRSAARKVKARRMPSKRNPTLECSNPLRHFPKLKGRGRPTKTKTWDIVARLANGKIMEQKFKGTKEFAFKQANRLVSGKLQGQRVREIMLDDGK